MRHLLKLRKIKDIKLKDSLFESFRYQTSDAYRRISANYKSNNTSSALKDRRPMDHTFRRRSTLISASN